MIFYLAQDFTRLVNAPLERLALSVVFVFLVALVLGAALFRAPLREWADVLAARIRARSSSGAAGRLPNAGVHYVTIPAGLTAPEDGRALPSAVFADRVCEWLKRERAAALAAGARVMELRIEQEPYLASCFWSGLATFAAIAEKENQVIFRVLYDGRTTARITVEALERLNSSSCGGSVLYVDAFKSDRFRKGRTHKGAIHD